MTIFNVVTFAEQGVFDVISNLGSLVARFLFLPIGVWVQIALRRRVVMQTHCNSSSTFARVIIFVAPLLISLSLLTSPGSALFRWQIHPSALSL